MFSCITTFFNHKIIVMKKMILLVNALLLCFVLMAQPPKGLANSGMVFGSKTTAQDALPVNDLPSFLEERSEAPIKVTGKVVEVCKSEGCWIKMETANGPLLIKMKDHSFFVPLSLNGKIIVADGIAYYKETSVEMLRHYAEDAGKTKAEIEAIKKPKKEITLQAKGILVM